MTHSILLARAISPDVAGSVHCAMAGLSQTARAERVAIAGSTRHV
jgi:hypothetical protein